MKVLFIAPVPPPYNGQTLAAKILLDYLKNKHQVEVVNLIKKSHKDGMTNISRVLEIVKILFQVLRKQKKADIIYLHVSESIAGNFRDLLIYMICYRKLSKVYIHLHGGSIKKWVFDRSKILYKINSFFIKKLSAVIVLGESHVQIYNEIVNSDRIYIVPNFAEDWLFSNEQIIVAKFRNLIPLKVLYLSNLIEGKGYEYLLKAFFEMDPELKDQVEITFAGGFGSNLEKQKILDEIKSYKQLKYVGFAKGEEKKKLFEEAHLFCFPSYLNEGQPISILEAYATGCCVITTGKSGIKDIFVDKLNGYKFDEKSSESINYVLKQILNNPNNLKNYGIYNYNLAKSKYRIETYQKRINEIMTNNQYL